MVRFEEHARAVGTEVIADTVLKLDLSSRPFTAECDSSTVWKADSVILATGAQARWLGLESEEKFKGFGVSACATCDGFFYRGKEVLVIGGGNTALEEALYLSNLASKVTVVHRRDEFRGEAILQKRLHDKANIEVMWDHVLEEVIGSPTDGVTAGRLRHVRTGEETEVPVSGIFIAIGHSPASELVADQLDTHMGGYVVTAPDSTATSIPRRVRRRRRHRPRLPPGRHLRRNGLHGSTRGGEVPGRPAGRGSRRVAPAAHARTHRWAGRPPGSGRCV